MTQIGAWEIDDGDVPRRLSGDREFLERHLENWIERDPSLLGGDIQWVARQLTLPDGSRLDLLGLTRDATWVIAELKVGPLRTSTVLQALHYFVQIAGMTDGELRQRIQGLGSRDNTVNAALEELDSDADDTRRDYRLLVAGVGEGGPAEQAASTLARHGLNVRVQVVTFQMLRDSAGRRILIREIDEDAGQEQRAGGARWSLDQVLSRAEQFGVREGFERIWNHLLERGYRTYQKKYGLNFNLGSQRQIFWVRPAEGGIVVGYLGLNFPALFGVDMSRVEADMGPFDWSARAPEEALAAIRTWADVIDGYRAESQPAAPDAAESLGQAAAYAIGEIAGGG